MAGSPRERRSSGRITARVACGKATAHKASTTGGDGNIVTRIVCITDTHIGCGEAGFKRQPRYVDEIDTLFDTLRHWLEREQPDLLVHAGDVTDHGTEPEIDEAVQRLAALNVPVAVALGNHDLCELESITWWRQAASAIIASGRQEILRHSLPHCDVLLVTHHWRPEQPYHWVHEEPQAPSLDANQEAALDQALAASPRPTLLVSHAPAHAIPPAQTGFDEPVHVPHSPYAASLDRLARRHPHLRLVLSGHNHTHAVEDTGAFVSCSTTAFNERPAELRVIDVDEEAIHVRTLGLAEAAHLPVDLEPSAAWGVGTAPQRAFDVPVAATGVGDAASRSSR